jgi:hypothetical protein
MGVSMAALTVVLKVLTMIELWAIRKVGLSADWKADTLVD